MKVERSGRGAGRSFGSAARLRACLLLVAVPLLLLPAEATRAGEYFKYVTAMGPGNEDVEPRRCDKSPECSCNINEDQSAAQTSEHRSGEETGGAKIGFEKVATGNPGNTTPNGLGTDPVALFTGGFHHEVVDLELPGVVPIRFIRRYDSRSRYDSPLGFGWSFNYDMRLYRFPANSVVVRSGCGDRNPYQLPSNGVYQLADPERGGAPALVESPPGTFTLTYRSGERAIFGADGLLEKLEDPQGNRLEFMYLPERALQGIPRDTPSPASVMTVAYVRPLWKVREWTKLEGYTGREVTLEYDTATGRLTRLVASDGREVLYAHQDATFEPSYRGNLAKVTGLEGLIEEYRYQDESGDPHNLTVLRESEWVAPLANHYDAQDRVNYQLRGNMRWDIAYGTNGLRTVTRTLSGGSPIYTTSFTFDSVGNVTQKIDALGNRFDYTRAAGSPYVDLVKVWKAGYPLTLQRQADLDFDAAGNLTQRRITLDSGEVLTETWTYDHNWVASYQIVSSFDPGKVFRTEYTFYRDGSLLTDPPTNVMEIKRQKSPGSFETTLFTYDGNGQLATITPPAVVPADGLVIRRSYYGAGDPDGGAGLLKSTKLWLGATLDPHLARTYTYDARGRLASTTDAKGYPTSFVFDARGRLTSTTNALGEQSLFSYRGPNEGPPTKLDGNPDASTPGPNLTRIEVGRTVAGGEGRVTRLQWNVHGDLVTVERKKDSVNYEVFASYTYDSEGRRKTASDALGRTTTFGWDGLRRLTGVTDAAIPSHTTTFAYDAVGNRTRLTDALARVTDFVYDDADRLLETRALGPNPDEITGFSYDAAGNVTQVSDPKGQATAYAYDSLSRLERVTQALGLATPGDPNDFSVRYAYDGRGRLARTVNARGNALDYAYAPWGGLEAILHYPTEADAIAQSNLHHTVAYAYDLEGHLTSTSDGDPGLGFSGPLYTADPTTGYDALGRLRALSVHFPATGAPRTLTSTYNRFGEREQLDLTQGAETLSHIWTYDKMGRLDFATLPGSPTPIDFTPFADDTLARITRPSGTTTDYTYFAQGPVQTITVKAGGATQIQRLAYGIDPVKDITSLAEQHATSDPMGAYVYGYDAANRLQLGDYPAAYGLPAAQRYAYDPAGNRDDANASFVALGTYSYDANNRLTASPGIPSYTFDADGNLTARTGETFGYDFANQLRSYSKSGTAASYAYDPFGRRIQKSVNGVTTWYLWDGDQLLAEYDGSGARTVRYAYAGAFAPIQVAYKDGAGEDVYDVHTDHLDTPRMLTDNTGAVVWREAHEAFGKAVLDPANTVTFNIRFPGQYFDAESGLHDNLHRYFDPVTGRYISADPIARLRPGENPFVYVRNNPLRFVDPLGLDWEYSQSSGSVTHVDNATGERTSAGTGYSGHGEGLNNPAMENLPNVGPITQGTYDIGPQQDNVTGSGTTLPGSMRLDRRGDPDPYGRSGFLIHGDNRRGDQSASQGCPVVPRNVRNQIGSSGDNTLRVVP